MQLLDVLETAIIESMTENFAQITLLIRKSN